MYKVVECRIDITSYFFAIILTPKSNGYYFWNREANSSQHGFTNAQLQMNKIEYLKSEHFSFHQCGQMSFSVLLTHEYNVHKGGTRNEKKISRPSLFFAIKMC